MPQGGAAISRTQSHWNEVPAPDQSRANTGFQWNFSGVP